MANILFVSGSYFPHATANAVCTKKFEDVLKAHGHSVIYCNRKHDLYEPDHHIVDGTEIYTVGMNSDLFYQTSRRLMQLDMPNHMGVCVSMAFNIFRAAMKLTNPLKSSRKLRETAIDHYLDRYSDKIADLIRSEQISMVMSVSMPFLSHHAVLRAMHKLEAKGHTTPKWIAYCIDAYWSKAGISPSEIPYMKAQERDVFSRADAILFLDTIKEDYSGTEFDKFRNKIRMLPLPLFDLKEIKPYNSGINPIKNAVNFLFAGTIYDDFSNMESLDSILRKSSSTISALHFMGKIYPKSLAILERLKTDYPDRIITYGKMPYDFAKGSMQRADILLNLANDNTNQIPSKIFEYISCRKPILNIYRNADDIGTKYLREYPLAFNFDVNHIDSEIVRMNLWLHTISSKSVTIEELREIYQDALSEKVTGDFYTLCKPYLS